MGPIRNIGGIIAVIQTTDDSGLDWGSKIGGVENWMGFIDELHRGSDSKKGARNGFSV